MLHSGRCSEVSVHATAYVVASMVNANHSCPRDVIQGLWVPGYMDGAPAAGTHETMGVNNLWAGSEESRDLDGMPSSGGIYDT